MQETEAKFYVHDLNKIKTRLQPPPPFGHLPQIRNKTFQEFISFYSRIWGRLGGSLIQPRVLEMNIRFDLPGSPLHAEGRVLRLRQDTAARLTYKGAGKNGTGVLSREEIEFEVENFEKAKRFLEALGYQKLIYYEKYRTTYTLRETSEGFPRDSQSEAQTSADLGGLVHVMLDEMPYGNFVEIEGETIESIRLISDRLNLKWNAAIPRSYHALFEHLHDVLKLSFEDISFANFAGIKVAPTDLGVQAADH